MKPGIGLIGRKLGMTQVFRADGNPVAVTVLEAGPCSLVAQRSEESHGYSAVQMGFEDADAERLSKPLIGYFKKAAAAPKKILREFRIPKEEKVTVGSTVTVEMFKPGDRVDVTGQSIGKGFQGGPKRWHWKGGPQTHGSMSHRAPGSIGSSTDPSRVFKGHHLPGRMGGDTVTTQALEVVRVDAQNNLLLVRGSVPGQDRGVVLIRKSRKPPRMAAPKPVSKKKAAVQPAGKPAAAKPAPAGKQPQPAAAAKKGK